MADTKQLIAVFVFSIALIGGLSFWVSSKNQTPELLLNNASTTPVGPLSPKELATTDPGITDPMNPIATITTNKGVIKLELFKDKMPITAGNFIKLADEGFYNGTKFHRVIDGFMIQGGDPNSKSSDTSTYGKGGPGYTIQDEFVSDPLLSNVRGTIAMANTGQPDSGGSQFFINTVDNTGLDFDKSPATSKHPVFGRVIEGMDVVDAISKVQTGPGDIPVDPVVVESVTVQEPSQNGDAASTTSSSAMDASSTAQ